MNRADAETTTSSLLRGGRRSLRAARWLPLWILLVLLNSTVSSSALNALEQGMEAPDFQLQDLARGTHRFADLKGQRLTVLVFWATWSESSQKALRQMQELQRRYAGSGLAVIAINVDRQEMSEAALAGIGQAVARQQISVPVLIDHGLKVFNSYGVIAVPSLVVLDKERVIRRELSGFPLVGSDELKQYLEATLENRPLTVQTAVTGYQPDKKAVRLWNMGMSTLKSERTAGHAKGWFEKAIAADPSFSQPYLSLGEWYYRQHNLAEARKQFEAVLKHRPDNALAMTWLGQVLLDQGDLNGAEQWLTKSQQTNESYLPTYYLLGVLKGRQNDRAQALEWFKRAEQRNPRDYKLFVHKGRFFEEQGNQAAAAADYRKALELMSEQP